MKQILFASLISLGLLSTAQAGIIVSSWDMQSGVYNPSDIASQNTVTLPFQATDMTSLASGIATNTTSYDFEVVGDSAWFQIDVNHQLYTDQTSSFIGSSSSAESIFFTVTGTESLAYSLDGFFTATGEANKIGLRAALLDFTNLVPGGRGGSGPTTLFSNWQDSRNATDESFLLGGTGGNNPGANFVVGSLTGLLTPGVTYGLFYGFGLQDFEESPVSAVGQLNLHIMPVVPEPSSLVLFGIGGIALVGYGRRRRKFAAPARISGQ